MKAERCDLGIAFDGDGDRIGVVDAKGRILWGDQLLIVLARDVLRRHPGAPIIADVKASQVLFDEIARAGGKPVMSQTGHSLIKARLAETGAPLAGEMSGHIFFADRYYGFDDAVYVAVRLSAFSRAPTRASSRCSTSCRRCSTRPSCGCRATTARKFAVVEEVARPAARGAAPTWSTSTGCGCAMRTAGGCCAPRTPRRPSSCAPKSTSQAGLDRLKAAACRGTRAERAGAAGIEGFR